MTVEASAPPGGSRAAARRRRSTGSWAVLAVIAAGGAAGALARHGIAQAWPRPAAGFPWATFVINVTGCVLIGLLMTMIGELGAHRLIRPFLGVGVLGGYTTFSTYTVETQQLVAAGHARTALTYLVLTALAALTATQVGIALARLVIRTSRRGRKGAR